MTRILNIPGWQDSGPNHWQTQWERLDANITRVVQDDWETPELGPWLTRLRAKLTGEPTVLCGHGLGSILAVHAAAGSPSVVGALLVAPSDVEGKGRAKAFKSFAPIPRGKLPFPAIVIASRNDEYCSMPRAKELSEAWGARLVDVGKEGHLNAEPGLGTWPEGRALLRSLCARAPFTLDRRLAQDTSVAGESALSLLLLMNEARYPWFLLVPKRAAASELFDLSSDDQRALALESTLLCEAMATVFRADKMNVGALGNIVRQLHVHHVVRTLGDPAWPGPVWSHSPRVPRDGAAKKAIIDRLFTHAGITGRFERKA